MGKIERREVYKAIDGEREYQDKVWPRSKGLSTIGEFVLLRKYIRDFEDHYALEKDDPVLGMPFTCLHDLRKMATILVRAMENNGVVFRQ